MVSWNVDSWSGGTAELLRKEKNRKEEVVEMKELLAKPMHEGEGEVWPQ